MIIYANKWRIVLKIISVMDFGTNVLIVNVFENYFQEFGLKIASLPNADKHALIFRHANSLDELAQVVVAANTMQIHLELIELADLVFEFIVENLC